MQRKEFYLFGAVLVALLTLFLLPTDFENPSLTDSIFYEKSKVISVDNSDLHTISIVTLGTQKLNLLVKTGSLKGDTIQATNILLGQKKLDKIFKEGDKVLTVMRMDETKENCIEAKASDYYRQDLELFLFLVFSLSLILFAKFTGFKAIISFVFTALAIWKLLIPAFLKGYSPLFVSIGVVFVCTLVIVLLVGGLTKKGFVALLGTMAGVILTALLANVFAYLFKIPGTVQEYAEALLYAGFSNLDFTKMFISIIFISSAGAVMDVAMDIAASQDELVRKLPSISAKELIHSGFRIASPVIGSMTTTLLFAYSGNFMFAFMAFMAKGVSLQSLINTTYISAEILHTMVGSFGLVLVAPLTAIIGGYIYTRHKES